jgi:mRNA interferase MazF
MCVLAWPCCSHPRLPRNAEGRGYPFEVALPDALETSGVVLADQVRCLDWRKRRAKHIEPAPSTVVGEVVGKVQALLK